MLGIYVSLKIFELLKFLKTKNLGIYYRKKLYRHIFSIYTYLIDSFYIIILQSHQPLLYIFTVYFHILI